MQFFFSQTNEVIKSGCKYKNNESNDKCVIDWISGVILIMQVCDGSSPLSLHTNCSLPSVWFVQFRNVLRVFININVLQVSANVKWNNCAKCRRYYCMQRDKPFNFMKGISILKLKWWHHHHHHQVFLYYYFQMHICDGIGSKIRSGWKTHKFFLSVFF